MLFETLKEGCFETCSGKAVVSNDPQAQVKESKKRSMQYRKRKEATRNSLKLQNLFENSTKKRKQLRDIQNSTVPV